MTPLIKALVGVKDPLTLIGFICVVLLLAFRTRAVPQLFFGLLQTKLTRERFALLLHRAMLYGLILVVTLCGVAVTGQVLAHVSQPTAAGVEELTAELRSWKAGEEAKQQAAASFRDSQKLIADQKLDQAVESLQASIKAVPTLTAEYALAYLYKQRGDAELARQAAVQVAQRAQDRGETMAALRADRLAAEASTGADQGAASGRVPRVASDACKTSPGTSPFVNVKCTLPDGGLSYEAAKPLSLGSYRGVKDYDKKMIYSVQINAKQTLTFAGRSRDEVLVSLQLGVYDRDGAAVAAQSAEYANSMISLTYPAAYSGTAYVSVTGAARDAVFVISVQ